MSERSVHDRIADSPSAEAVATGAGAAIPSASSILQVAIGGAVGSAARYGLGLWFPDAQWSIPVTTFSINIVGALILGILLESLIARGADSGWRRRLRLTVGTGFCGGFTTYSSLAVAAEQMIQHGHLVRAALYGAGSVLAGTVCAFVGIVASARAYARSVA